jgi:catechol-2,3-dioxygenase
MDVVVQIISIAPLRGGGCFNTLFISTKNNTDVTAKLLVCTGTQYSSVRTLNDRLHSIHNPPKKLTMVTYRCLLFIALTATAISTSTNALIMSTSTTTIASKNLSLGAPILRRIVQTAARNDSAETLDVKGILWMEHVNLVVGSKTLAEYFYLEFLGFTKDLSSSFHVNMGQQQFHLAENGEPAQIVAGSIGLVVPSLVTLRERIPAASETLKTTKFTIISDDTENACLTLTCPWGNLFHIYSVENDSLESTKNTPRKMENLHAEGGAYGAHRMAIRGTPGIRYIEIACPVGKSHAIAQFYKVMLGCNVMETTVDVSAAIVCVGPGVHLAFVESQNWSENASEAMEGVHVCFYANDFEGLYQRLAARKLIWTNPRFVHLDTCDTWEEAVASQTLRFKDIIDLSTGEKILELEHETRPLRHGQYLKVPKYEPR